MPRTAYLDTSIFLEMGTKGSTRKARIRELLQELMDDNVRLYTSILTVQELAVATYRGGTTARDIYGDVISIARVYTLTKEVALTAAKREAELKDLTDRNRAKRSRTKPETEDQKLDRICENRRRKWDCFHIATAQQIGCSELYTTDTDLQKRPSQLGLRSLKALTPESPVKTIKGPMFENVDPPKDTA